MKQSAAEIQRRLFAMQDLNYKSFQCGLMPTVDADTVIGVRTPALRKLAKEIKGTPEASDFLVCLPHVYYEENNLHGFLLCGEKDFDQCIQALDEFLPHVNNWATCDSLRPEIFKGHLDDLLPHIERWIASDHPYTVRFAVKMLMDFYLDEVFLTKYPRMAASVSSDEYYVKMMIAWYFAEALVRQWDQVIPYFAEPGGTDMCDGVPRPVLEKWVHNKAIQKAVESFRVTPEQKTYLKTIKIK